MMCTIKCHLKSSFLILFFCSHLTTLAHGSWTQHYDDIIAVFGLEGSPSLRGWVQFISSDMIDKKDFYNELQRKHPGFTCKHRLLFHWGYDAVPWNKDLEKKVKDYCKVCKVFNEESIADTIRLFQYEIRSEQKRRNRLINQKTEDLFGFAHGGKDASYARFFASMAYNIHLLGDYTSDNTDLQGLQPLNKLLGSIITELRNFDKNQSEEFIQGINDINRKYADVEPQKKADALLKYFKESIPRFVQVANGGSIKRRLEYKGFKFREIQR